MAFATKDTAYRVGLPRRDLTVTTYGVTVKPGLSLGGYATFARYPDHRTPPHGRPRRHRDRAPAVTDALQSHAIEQTGIHKHLLAHEPDLWWVHIHGLDRDPGALAVRVRAALDHTATPPPVTPSPTPPPIDLDTAAIDNALGTTGTNDGGIYKFTFVRDETITVDGRAVPPAAGVTTALNFQPTGGGRAAINGDFAMTADRGPTRHPDAARRRAVWSKPRWCGAHDA